MKDVGGGYAPNAAFMVSTRSVRFLTDDGRIAAITLDLDEPGRNDDRTQKASTPLRGRRLKPEEHPR